MESHRLNLTWEANRFAQPQKAISRYQKIEADTIQFHIDFNLSTPNPLQKKKKKNKLSQDHTIHLVFLACLTHPSPHSFHVISQSINHAPASSSLQTCTFPKVHQHAPQHTHSPRFTSPIDSRPMSLISHHHHHHHEASSHPSLLKLKPPAPPRRALTNPALSRIAPSNPPPASYLSTQHRPQHMYKS